MSLDLFGKLDFFWKVPSFISWVIFFVSSWVFLLIILGFSSFSCVAWKSRSLVKNVLKSVFKESKSSLKASQMALASFFFLLLIQNLFGLVPYVFSVTSQVVFVLMFSFGFWAMMNISNFAFDFVGALSHMTPLASPSFLIFLLNVMEFVSNFIRFITLSLRLSMNMTTGHILLTLLSTNGLLLLFSGKMGVMLMFAFGVGYLLFECGVSFIQAFVFSLLCSQYTAEHN